MAVPVSVDTVAVGNYGNPHDPLTGNLYGGVDYSFRMGTTEVTLGQYAAFLNAIAATDNHFLYNAQLASNPNVAGIVRIGSSGSYSYSVVGSPDRPVTYVGWGDAARFANWLHNGQPSGPQNASTTEDGAYTLNGAVSLATLRTIVRNPGARWFIPSENEWYKAAYHKNDGVTDHYWQYPLGADFVPTSALPSGSGGPSLSHAANFFADDHLVNGINDGYSVTGSIIADPTKNYLTDAGAFTDSVGPYNTFDQAGNVWEWNESMYDDTFRVLRGGSWRHNASHLASSSRNFNYPTYEEFFVGFRVAAVPEPSSAFLAILGIGILSSWRRRSSHTPPTTTAH